ncbi:MAG: hypothetical protein HFJ52_04090 [Clostridia bacterium]|nr:hypothetical protein [Clostridia bacterium]
MSDSKNILTKEALRKSVGMSTSEFDEELQELEAAAIQKMELSGINPEKIVKDDNLVVTTIKAYVKANFRFADINLSAKFQEIFEENKNYMRSTSEYTKESSDSNE